MIPAVKDLVLYQGDSFNLFARFRQAVWDPSTLTYVPGSYINLTGVTPKAQIRKTTATTTVVAEFAFTLGNQSDPNTVGSVNFTLSHSIMAAVVAGDYVWDVQLTFADASVATYLAGAVSVIAEVTR